MLWRQVWNWLHDEEGQDLTEYALLVVLIAVACVAAVTTLGTQIMAMWNNAAATLGGL